MPPTLSLFRSASIAGVAVFSRSDARHGGFQILKRLFSGNAGTMPHLKHNGPAAAAATGSRLGVDRRQNVPASHAPPP